MSRFPQMECYFAKCQSIEADTCDHYFHLDIRAADESSTGHSWMASVDLGCTVLPLSLLCLMPSTISSVRKALKIIWIIMKDGWKCWKKSDLVMVRGVSVVRRHCIYMELLWIRTSHTTKPSSHARDTPIKIVLPQFPSPDVLNSCSGSNSALALLSPTKTVGERVCTERSTDHHCGKDAKPAVIRCLE